MNDLTSSLAASVIDQTQDLTGPKGLRVDLVESKLYQVFELTWALTTALPHYSRFCRLAQVLGLVGSECIAYDEQSQAWVSTDDTLTDDIQAAQNHFYEYYWQDAHPESALVFTRPELLAMLEQEQERRLAAQAAQRAQAQAAQVLAQPKITPGGQLSFFA